MSVLIFPTSADHIRSATVVRWLKRPGELFAGGDPLVELEVEDALVVVEAAGTGLLAETLVQPGQTIAPGANLARVTFSAKADVTEAHSPNEGNAVSQSRPATDAGQVTPILMPQAGNTMEEGTVIAWHVAVGDRIAVGQTICEIETDKATMEFESPEAGRLAKILAPVGEPIAVKQPIALLAETDADADAWCGGERSGVGSQGAGEEAADVRGSPDHALVATEGLRTDESRQPAVATAVATSTGRVKASPAARKVAAARGVELATVGGGRGPGGRILSTDVPSMGQRAGIGERGAAGAGDAVTRPLSKMRRAIGLNLQKSKQTVPHFYMRLTIDADPLLAFYNDQRPATDCTLNDLIVLALGRAMRDFPAVRSRIEGDQLVEQPHANIGIAVGVDDGLVVPVVLAVDTRSLAELAAETKRIVENARRGRLENIGQGNFTISNLGMFGVEEFSAIINPPESGILAVGAARETVIARDGALRAGRVMTMTLSADHRVVDGVIAAKFMARLKAILEDPAHELA